MWMCVRINKHKSYLVKIFTARIRRGFEGTVLSLSVHTSIGGVYPHPVNGEEGVPPSQVRMGVPRPLLAGWGNPPPKSSYPQLERHSVYLLRRTFLKLLLLLLKLYFSLYKRKFVEVASNIILLVFG